MSFFLGIAFDDDTRAAFTKALSLAMPHFPLAKWERPEKAHLTLVFLASLIPDDALVADVVKRHAPFTLSLKGGGTFRDRILWLGVGGELKPLQALQQELQNALEVKDEHEGYTPHVTLARGKRLTAAMLTTFESAPFAVNHVTLFESARGEYRLRATYPLKPTELTEPEPEREPEPGL